MPQKTKKQLIKHLIIYSLCSILFFSLSFGFVGANGNVEGVGAGSNVNGSKPDSIVSGSKEIGIPNPLKCDTFQECIGNIIKTLLGIVGSLALLMFIYGGFTWMLSGGNEQKVKKGKDILTWATLGLVIIFTSYAILKFVFKVLEAST